MPALVEREVGALSFDDGCAAQIADAQEDDVAARSHDGDLPVREYDAHRLLLALHPTIAVRVRVCHR